MVAQFLVLTISLAAIKTSAQESHLDGLTISGATAIGLGKPESRRDAPSSLSTAPSISIPDSLFFLSPGDRLAVRWWGVGKGGEDLVVDTRHEIVVPDIGKLNIRKLSLREVRDSIETMIRRRTSARMIDLMVTKVTEARVAVAGHVPNPGFYTVPAGTRASNVISLAGISIRESLFRSGETVREQEALKPTPSSLRRVRLVRSRGDSIWLDLARAFNSGDDSEDPPLFGGDRLLFTPRKSFIQIAGDIPRQGQFEVVEGETLGALLKAAGVIPHPKVVRVFDNQGGHRTVPVDQPVDSSMVLVHIEEPVVPPRSSIVWVNGRVKRQGPILWRPEMTPIEAIEAAGGTTLGKDSIISVAIKHSWRSLTAARSPRVAESFQNPEIRLALAAHANQTHGTYSDLNSPLESGDTVWVHATDPVVWVGGEVRRPGFVPWAKGRSRQEYIALAGGYAGRPWKAKAVVFDLYTEQQVRGDDPIRPGAAIIIPEKKYVDPLTWLAAVGTIVTLFVTAGTFYISATQ